MKKIFAASVAALAAGLAFGQTPPAGYPADYSQTIANANKEGKVVIYSALDTKAAQPLIRDFNALYPNVKVEYNDMNSTELYNRFIAEQASGQGGADVMWSSAMDLQVKLVEEGHAMSYVVTLPLYFSALVLMSFANAAWSCGTSPAVTSRLL